jgi:IPT/TIG domain
MRSIGTVIALVAIALIPADAAAKPVVVGSPLTGEFHRGFVRNAGTFFNSALADPAANLVSPVDGIVVRFQILGGEGGPYRLRVLSPEGGSVYRATASTPPLTFGGAEPHFRPLKIEAGDTIGLDLPAEGKVAAAETGPESAYAFWVPPLAADTALPYSGTDTGVELGFNAEVLPVPTVTRIVPKAVPFHKGGRVKIFGKDFSRVTRVSFGARRARRFKVVSERLIVATAPPRKNRLRTQVRVQTEAGISATSGRSAFLFAPCPHPKLPAKTCR